MTVGRLGPQSGLVVVVNQLGKVTTRCFSGLTSSRGGRDTGENTTCWQSRHTAAIAHESRGDKNEIWKVRSRPF